MIRNKCSLNTIILIASIINIASILGFCYLFVSRCNYENLVEKIKKEKQSYYGFSDIFCDYENKVETESYKINLFFIFLNLIYVLSIVIALTAFIVSIYQEGKCGLTCSLIFFFFPIIISLLDIILAFSYIGSLDEDKLNFSEELKKEILHAYSLVKDRKTAIKILTIISLIITIVCGLLNAYVNVKFKKENKDLMEYLDQDKQNNSEKNSKKDNKNTMPILAESSE